MNYQETAQRYAKALLNLAQERSHSDSVISQMEMILKQIQGDKDLRHFLTSPVSKTANQKEILNKIFDNQPVREEVQGLLCLLAEKRRFFLLPQICRALQKLIDANNGVIRGSVISSNALDAKEQEKLAEAISHFTKKKVFLDYKVDNQLIGGVVAKVGSYTFDDSMETQLRRMKEDLTVKEY